MKLSIIVPVYNAGLYIGDCLDSLLDQGLSQDEYEIIIVNDGSTDNSLSIVSGYKERFPCIKVLSQKNAGQSVARNTGINAASGDYLCFVDADDLLIRKKLSSISEIAHSCDLDIVTYGITTSTKNINGGQLSDDISRSEVLTGIDYIAKYNYNNSPCYYLIKQSFLAEKQLFFVPGRKCEDGIFTMQLFLSCEKMMHLDTCVYCYVMRENSTVTCISVQHQKTMIDDFQFAIRKLTEIIDETREKMSPACFTRCLCRRDSYVFFLLVRILKFKMSMREINDIIYKLKERKAYPIDISLDYGGKIKIISKLFNNPKLFKLICLLYRMVK